MKSPAEPSDLSNNEHIDAVFLSLNYQMNHSGYLVQQMIVKYHGAKSLFDRRSCCFSLSLDWITWQKYLYNLKLQIYALGLLL